MNYVYVKKSELNQMSDDEIAQGGNGKQIITIKEADKEVETYS